MGERLDGSDAESVLGCEMSTRVDRWNVVFVLPNMRMRSAGRLQYKDTADPFQHDLSDGPSTLGSSWLAIVHPEDPRVCEVAARAPAVRSLISIRRD